MVQLIVTHHGWHFAGALTASGIHATASSIRVWVQAECELNRQGTEVNDAADQH